MDLGELRAFVRTYLDIEEEELSDAMVDQFLANGSRRVTTKERFWPWLAKSWDITTVADVAAYDLEVDVAQIDSVRLVGRNDPPLRQSGHSAAESRWSSMRASGTPREFSRWGSRLYLWPIPSEGLSVEVRGWREPTKWWTFGAGAVPDFPEEFHELIARWAIASEYQRQDDTEMAEYNRQNFEADLDALHKRYMSAPATTPIVIGGGRPRQHGFQGQPYPFD